MGEDDRVFLFLQRIDRMNQWRIGRPFKFRDEIGYLFIEVICRGFNLVCIGQTFGHAVYIFAGNRADAIFNFEGLTDPPTIFPIDEFFAQIGLQRCYVVYIGVLIL